LDRKNVVVLGSTGSIGKQALEVIGWFPDRFKLVGLATNQNIELLEEQVAAHGVSFAAVADLAAAKEFGRRSRGSGVVCLPGPAGLKELASLPDADLILVAVSGIAGLVPTLEAISSGKTVAMANKEALVAGGSLVMSAAVSRGVQVIPVDSEHSAIHQCLLRGERRAGARPGGRGHISVARLIITGSGGPFHGMTGEQLRDVTPEQALRHPTWQMGAKITIDSATLMNKGLEVIEARWLFDVDYPDIEVLIHPQSIVHGLVVYQDGAVIAQLGRPDMRVPIQYALMFPERIANRLEPLDLAGAAQLTFAKPDLETFHCLALAIEAGKAGGTMPAVLNAANEVAVMGFLQGKIPFLSIAKVVEGAMSRHAVIPSPGLDEILNADGCARQVAEHILSSRW
jgi:1-deoxy-D-xylulose-5-phosphate reductoisomerase